MPIFSIVRTGILVTSLFLPLTGECAEKKACVCTCVVKEDESYSTRKGSGSTREAAGESLKKNLGKKKCELTPDCVGGC